jgi:hypothetical protein
LQIYGQSHINAAFTYTRSTGNRFNGPERGAWYCSYDTLTSAAEVGFHRTRELGYIGIYEDEARYVELLADFIGDFPDLTSEKDHPALIPDSALGYPPSTELGCDRGDAGGLPQRRARPPEPTSRPAMYRKCECSTGPPEM